MFEFLFKFSPYLYQQGEFVLSASTTMMAVAVVVVALAVPGVLRYRRVTGTSTALDRGVLAGLRFTALAILLFLLLRPSLVVSTAVPQENFVAILIDDSRSMQIADQDGLPRSEFVGGAFGEEGSALLDALSERFRLRFFAFSGDARRIDSVAELGYGGDRTHLGASLRGVYQELAAVPLSGLVLVTDGADNSLEGTSESLAALRAASVPVFPVGLGAERFDRDIEVSRVETPRRVLAGAQVAADVVIEHKGFGGETVLLMVEGDEGILSTQEVELPGRGDSTAVKAQFSVEEPGPQVFTFRIATQEGEMVTRNNERPALVTVQDRTDKVLYFEGEPSHDVGFTRRVADKDENIQLVILLRMAENKFNRFNLDDPDELAELFPRTREELYGYRALVLGSVEPEFFTDDQLQMIVDFVSERGGSLMMFGGGRAFSEGGWAGTPVADVLPVVLRPAAEEESRFFSQVKVMPTVFGRTHPVTQFGDTMESSLERWRTLPPLAIVNRVVETKPGASTLLVGDSDELDEEQVVLAYQRYGRGMAATFTPFDVFTWQMHADIPLEDQTHETLWRQLLRWLVHDVPGPVAVSTPVDRFAPDQRVPVTARVRDETFIEVNNAEVTARIESPSGLVEELRLDWSVETDGEYRGSFVAEEEGFYRIETVATRGGSELGRDESFVDVAPLATEYFGAERRTALLERIAEETGGRTYTRESVSSLPADLRHSEGGTTVVEVKDLWDLPVNFLILVALVGIEWGYRKWRKLA